MDQKQLSHQIEKSRSTIDLLAQRYQGRPVSSGELEQIFQEVSQVFDDLKLAGSTMETLGHQQIAELERSLLQVKMTEVDREALIVDNRRQQALLDAIFEADPSGLAVLVGDDLRFAFANPAYRYLIPNPFKDLVGCGYDDVWPEKDHYCNLDRLRKVLTTGQPVQVPGVEIIFPDGTRRAFNLQARRIEWGSEAAVLLILWDITDSKETEKQLRSTALFPEQNPHPILRLRPDGLILYANPASRRLLSDYRPGEQIPEFWQSIARDAYQRGDSRNIDFEYLNRVYTFHVVPISDSGYINLYGRDITERKQLTDRLAEQADLFATVQDAIIATDAQLTITSWNQAAEQLYGWTQVEAVGQNASQLLRSELTEPQREDALRQTRQVGLLEGVSAHHTRYGRRILIEYHTKIRKDPNGELIGYISSNRDVTAHHLADGLSRALNEIHQMLLSSRSSEEILQEALTAGALAIGCETAALSLRLGDSWRASYVYGFPQEVIGTFMNDRQERHAVLAIQTHQPVAIGDAYHDPRVNKKHMRKWGVRSVLVIPVVTKEQAVGVIFFNFHQKVFKFQEAHLDFGIKLAAAISLALENEHLVESLKQDLKEREKLEAALRESEKQYRDLVQYAPTGIYEVDFRQKRFTSINDAICQITGYSREELFEIGPFALLDEDSQILFQQTIAKWLAGEKPEQNVEYRVKMKDGHVADALLNVSFTIDDQGNPRGATVVAVDITERKRAEEALRKALLAATQSDARYRELAESISDPLTVWDNQFRCVYRNAASRAISGLPDDHVLGKPFAEIYPDQVGTPLHQVHLLALNTRLPQHTEISWVCPVDGQALNYQISVYPTQQGIAALSRNITKRKQAEDAFRESQVLLRAVIDTTQDPVYVKDRQSRILLANHALANLVGKPIEDILGKTDSEYYDNAEVGLALRENDLKVMESEERISVEETVMTTEGWRTFLSAKAPYRDPQGQVIGIIGISRDITERKRAEQALRESETRYRELAECIADPFTAWDHKLRCIYRNDASRTATQLTDDQVLGKRFEEIYPYQVGTNVHQACLNVLENHQPQYLDIQWTRPMDGQEFYYQISIYPTREGIAVFSRDITEHKRAEEALRESEDRFRAIVETSEEGIALHKPDGTITYVNRRMAEMLDYPPEEIIGKSSLEFVDEDHREAAIHASKRVSQNGSFQEEWKLRNKNGSILWTLCNVSPRRDDEGNFLGYLAMHTDITGRKRTEELLKKAHDWWALLGKILEEDPNPVVRVLFNGQVIYCNPAAGKIPAWNLKVGLPLPEQIRLLLDQAIQTQNAFEQEVQLAERYYIVTIMPVSQKQYANLFGRDITELRQTEEESRSQRVQIELQHRLLEQREQERLIIARDLHDGPVQALVGAHYAIEGLIFSSNDETIKQALQPIRDTIKEQVGELRSYAGELRPPVLDKFGLAKAIRSYVETFKEKHPDIRVQFSEQQVGGLIQEEKRLGLFRIFQEAMANIGKHARATEVAIRLDKTEDQIVLEIQDNGAGFEMPEDWLELARAGHLGLVGMKERVEAIGGRMEIQSQPGQGTHIRVDLPA